MASRAPTLAKPKAKPKVTSKKIVAKSTPSSSAVTLKPVAKTAAKAATKVAPAKATVKTASAKLVTKAVKTPSTKTSAPAKTAVKHDAHKSLAKPKLVSEASAKASGTASFEAAPAVKPRRRGKAEIRTRIYWAVFNQALRRVAVFEFDQREEAEKRAARLTQSTGEHHFLQKIKALVQ